MMIGQTTAFCDHVYAQDQNNVHALVYAQKKSFFLYAQGIITGKYGSTLSRVSNRISLFQTTHIAYLPDEMLLYIFGFLEQKHLAVCCRVNRDFYRVSTDSSLWKEITIIKRQLADLWLLRLSQLRPVSLHLVCCRGGPQLTSSGLRQLFRSCADNLEELNISGCSRGELIGSSLLLHCSSRCHNLHSLNVSWCQISIKALELVLEANQGICDLDLSGCNVTDTILYIIESKLPCLKRLHLYGNSSVTSSALESLASKCKCINDLNVGQCCQVNDSCLINVSSNLCCLQCIELRGCTQVSDMGIKGLVRNSSQLQSIGLAACQNVGDSALTILDCVMSLRSLDVTSCPVSDVSVQHLICSIGDNLVKLKLGSTAITDGSVFCISQSCSNWLEELDLSYCRSVTAAAVQSVVQSCQRLQKLAVYGLPFRTQVSTPQWSDVKIDLAHPL
ncbi:F-box/LRR-repeat protein 20-like isoform X2 [Corticium candelabrum]|uniref:F-box/LRR-repeat protein 20-like isoform X2 n=1 Tax=Corticium candelabrum TaxID=121492 RepID=UPI002E263527|nr:F-box/LRR-repeat protein 20-like isoform X2 [Corticium candelabrum]